MMELPPYSSIGSLAEQAGSMEQRACESAPHRAVVTVFTQIEDYVEHHCSQDGDANKRIFGEVRREHKPAYRI